MIARRELLIGAASLAALGVAEALRPRTVIALGGDVPLSDLVPSRLGIWSAHNGGDIIVPKVEGSLADKLYSDQLTRLYINDEVSEAVMIVIAYGGAQNDMLQLHRPESCYPAIGFTIIDHRFAALPIGAGQHIPVVELTAKAGDRIEDIVYWARVAEDLPLTMSAQRSDLLKTAMQGFIGDGALVRASAIRRGDGGDKFAPVRSFLQDLVAGLPADQRKVLIGTQRGDALKTAAA